MILKYVDRARMVVLVPLAMNTGVITVVLFYCGKVMSEGDIHGDYLLKDDQNNEMPLLLAIFALLAGMASVASLITALHHVRVWSSSSRAAAQASAWISFMLVVLAMSYAISELGNTRDYAFIPGSSILRITIIVLAPTHLLHNLALYISPQSRRNLDPGLDPSQADDQIDG